MPFPLYQNYILEGKIPGYTSGTVTATNKTTTGTPQTISIESDGSYLIDCANFDNGWNPLDTIELSTSGRYVQITINTGLFPEGRRVDIEPSIVHRKRRH